MNASRIRQLELRLFRLPLAEPLEDARHGVHEGFELAVVTIRTHDGLEGCGYAYTGGVGGQAIHAMLKHDLGPFLLGRDAHDVEALYEAMLWHVHYVGRGGIAAFAISALDIALWDLRCRRESLPLWQRAGGAADRCKAYFGGIDLNFPLPKLLDAVSGYLARGANGVKIKVGQPSLATDRERVAAIRDLIGPDVALMVDANYSMTVDQAIDAARCFRDYHVLWFEEPIIPEDLAGYRRIAEASGIDLAMGENLHTEYEFAAALNSGTLAYIQPDACNCGGITGFLRAASLAQQAGIPVCSHGAQELHVSLVAAQKKAGWLELHAFPIEQYTRQPVRLENHLAIAPSVPGIGVSFELERLCDADRLPAPCIVELAE